MLRAQKIQDLPVNQNNDFTDAVVDGLSKPQKTLPSRFFYDARGSRLFEDITRLDEYYLTRTEASILRDHAPRMVEDFSADGLLVEYGSGSSLKTELLLAALPPTAAYVGIDVSKEALEDASQRLAKRFPQLDARAIVGNFSDAVALPSDLAWRPQMGFFPGSTIGNLVPTDAAILLAHFKAQLGGIGRLIVGVDLKKDPRRLVAAYNDASGVTADFNLNLLLRINRELGGTFELAKFAHKAIYDPRLGRIEMHLVSLTDHDVSVAGHTFRFRNCETIHTENSYKYSLLEFQNLARRAGWTPHHVWTDAESLFSVHELISGGFSRTRP